MRAVSPITSDESRAQIARALRLLRKLKERSSASSPDVALRPSEQAEVMAMIAVATAIRVRAWVAADAAWWKRIDLPSVGESRLRYGKTGDVPDNAAASFRRPSSSQAEAISEARRPVTPANQHRRARTRRVTQETVLSGAAVSQRRYDDTELRTKCAAPCQSVPWKRHNLTAGPAS